MEPRTVISLGRRLLDASSGLPEGSEPDQPVCDSFEPTAFCLALLRVGFAEPTGSPRLLVRSYRTVSPLPDGLRRQAVYFLWHFP